MARAVVTLISKPGCHLCDDARSALDRVAPDFDLERRELSILDDPALQEQYAEEIPVVLIDDRVHTIWRVDEQRLRDALTKATAAA